MERKAHPYNDTDVIDAHAPRTNQAVIGVGALAAYLLDIELIVALLGAQLIVGLTFGRRYCLPCLMYFELIQPLKGEGPLEDSRPPRFANVIGATFLSVATLMFALGATTVGWTLALIVAVLALLAATTGICMGCEIYIRVARLRGRTLRTVN